MLRQIGKRQQVSAFISLYRTAKMHYSGKNKGFNRLRVTDGLINFIKALVYCFTVNTVMGKDRTKIFSFFSGDFEFVGKQLIGKESHLPAILSFCVGFEQDILDNRIHD